MPSQSLISLICTSLIQCLPSLNKWLLKVMHHVDSFLMRSHPIRIVYVVWWSINWFIIESFVWCQVATTYCKNIKTYFKFNHNKQHFFFFFRSVAYRIVQVDIISGIFHIRLNSLISDEFLETLAALQLENIIEFRSGETLSSTE